MKTPSTYIYIFSRRLQTAWSNKAGNKAECRVGTLTCIDAERHTYYSI